jgi:hypothetical protein
MIIENKIPVIKTSVAALSVMLTHYKELLFLSILPILLMLPAIIFLPEMMMEIAASVMEYNSPQDLQNIHIPSEIFIYGGMFLYGYASLNINILRMIVLGYQHIFKLGIIPFKIVLKFIALSSLVSVLTFAPHILKIPLLEPIVFIFVAHFMLSLVVIALGNPLINWKIPFIYRINIALLQFIIPTLILALFALMGSVFLIIAKIFLIYWSAINLGLIFNCLTQK